MVHGVVTVGAKEDSVGSAVVREPDAVVARDSAERGACRRVIPEHADLLDSNVEHAPTVDREATDAIRRVILDEYGRGLVSSK